MSTCRLHESAVICSHEAGLFKGPLLLDVDDQRPLESGLESSPRLQRKRDRLPVFVGFDFHFRNGFLLGNSGAFCACESYRSRSPASSVLAPTHQAPAQATVRPREYA